MEDRKRPQPKHPAPPQGVSADYRDIYPDTHKVERKEKDEDFLKEVGEAVVAVKATARRIVQENEEEREELEREEALEQEEIADERNEFLSEAEVAEDEKEEEEGLPVRPRRRGKRRYGIIVGSAIMILALIGVVSIVWAVSSAIYGVATDDAQLREYDSFIAPVVMQDPQPFEDIQSANDEMVLRASLWYAIGHMDDENAQYDDMGRTVIPLVDVVDACHALFGPQCELQTFTTAEETYFTYEQSDNSFHIAPYSTEEGYTPYTVSSKKSGSTVVLKVGYVSASDSWNTNETNSKAEPVPSKYMEYVLQQNASTGTQYISAIRAVTE